MRTIHLQLHKLWLQQHRPQRIHTRSPGPSQAEAALGKNTLAHTATAAPALRVLRVHDQDVPADRAGRMVISGRMADVIAELNRLACP
jgi:hypothetical protein